MEIAGQMNYLKFEYERQKTLFEENISSRKKYLEAESDYKRAKATYESLRQKLHVLLINPSEVEKGNFSSVITIFSPINGNIASYSKSFTDREISRRREDRVVSVYASLDKDIRKNY